MRFIASAAVAAAATSKPFASSAGRRKRRIAGSSSTTRTRGLPVICVPLSSGKEKTSRVPWPLRAGLSTASRAAVRVHDALGDCEPKAGAFAAVGEPRIAAAHEFLEDVRQHVLGDAGPVIGYAHDHGLPRGLAVDEDARSPLAYGDGVADNIAERLLDQPCIGFDQRQLRRQPHLDLLRSTAPARRVCDPLGKLAQIDPVAVQLQRAGIDARHGEQIAHHVVEVFRLGLDLAQQVLLRLARRACRHTPEGPLPSRGSTPAECGSHARSKPAACCARARSRPRCAPPPSRGRARRDRARSRSARQASPAWCAPRDRDGMPDRPGRSR